MLSADAFTYLCAIFGALLVIYFRNYLRAVRVALKLPGPPNALPIIGHTHLINDSKQMESISIEVSQKYGPIMKIWLSVLPFFLITEPHHLQMLLGSNKCNTKHMFYALLHNFVGDGLITNSGERWKEHRRLIQPYFHVNLLKCFLHHFVRGAKDLVASLEEVDEVNITPYANSFVLAVLHASILGIPYQKAEETPFRKGKLFVPYRITKPWLLLDSLFSLTKVAQMESQQKAVLQAYTKQILADKLKQPDSDRKSDNFMEIFMEISKNNPSFTEKDIIDETSTLMLAGQDSIGAALAFSLHFIAKHADVQRRVYAELEEIFAGSERDECFEDVSSMKYLEQCVKETMRLCPSVPIICRTLTQEVQFSHKYALPKGSNIFISPFVTHRMPHVFADPLRFDPDRFAADSSCKMHPFAYFPFSAGPRNCIGYKFALIEIKVALSQIIRRFELSLVPGREDLNLSYRLTLRAKGGIWLRMRRRSLSCTR